MQVVTNDASRMTQQATASAASAAGGGAEALTKIARGGLTGWGTRPPPRSLTPLASNEM